MNTTDTIPTRKSIREIVQEAKNRALIEIVSTGKNTIFQAFAALKAEADELKGFDKTYVPPWESKDSFFSVSTVPVSDPDNSSKSTQKGNSRYRPDHRVYQIRNCRDALLKILDEKTPINTLGVILRLKDLGLTYKDSTVKTQLYQFSKFPGYYSKYHNGWAIKEIPPVWANGEFQQSQGFVKFLTTPA